jgi:hypothetical protein
MKYLQRYAEMLLSRYPGFKRIFWTIVSKLGLKRPGEVDKPVYQNSFVAKTPLHNEYMISLIHPSRGRPNKAFQTAKKWVDTAGDMVKVEHILSIDLSDSANFEYVKLFSGFSDGLLSFHNSSVVEATNRAAKEAQGNILIYLSDDFDCFPDWGLQVQKQFENENRPLLLKVDDCLQRMDAPIVTIPMMNYQLYQKLGYFWHPSYKSMFVDEDLYWTCFKIGSIKNSQHLKFPHNHPSNGKAEDDETYKLSAQNLDQGRAVFVKRKTAGFPL